MTKQALEWLKDHQATSLIPSRKQRKTINAARPNRGLQLYYERSLTNLVERMHKSTSYWLGARYRDHEDAIVADEAPVTGLRRTVRKLGRYWTKEFNRVAEETAKSFVSRSAAMTTQQIVAGMKDAGLTVEFTMTPAVRIVAQASIAENVSLIKSIPQQYFSDIEGLVMRSVQRGRDLKSLSDALEERYRITRNRAELIARDQNNKASAAIGRARQLDLGITQGIWQHSSAGKTYRPTHVKMNGKTFDLAKGMYDPAVGRWIMPGEEIGCRCTWRPVIPGFS